MRTRLPTLSLIAAVLGAATLPGCGVGMEPLMPTPILYTECGYEPLAHVPEGERWIPRRVYYATDRVRDKNLQEIAYGNKAGDEVSLGLALVGFGDRKMTRDKDLLIYVHGAKVNFYNANAFAAQLDHFMGRDMTSLAFAWPTRQNIVAYGSGADVQRAYRAAPALTSLLEELAQGTTARRIHIVCWSAGGRVVTAALKQLYDRHADDAEICASASAWARCTTRLPMCPPWSSWRRCRPSMRCPRALSSPYRHRMAPSRWPGHHGRWHAYRAA
jgi:hypothetical protein